MSTSIRRARRSAVVFTIFTLILALAGQTLIAEKGRFFSRPSALHVARAAHTVTALPGGELLVVGGARAAGVLKQTELIDPDGPTVRLGAEATFARASHTATLLRDGRVLVAGGRDDVQPLSSSEIYDPATRAFGFGPHLVAARSGHTATELVDGSILLAGGATDAHAEVFNQEQQVFARVGVMAESRQNHAAVRLADGRVLLAGGTDGAGNALKSAEVYNPSTETFSALPDMTTARVNATLRLLPDGKVQVIGGDADATMEIFNPAGYFTAKAYLTKTRATAESFARSEGRIAVAGTGFRSNEAVLDDLAGRKDFTSASDAGRTVIVGGFTREGELTNRVSVLSSSGAWVTTDRSDYSPGERVTVTGGGFQPGETVRLLFERNPETSPFTTIDTVADADGKIQNSDYVCLDTDGGVTFLLTATGQTSGISAQTSFTDGNVKVEPVGVASFSLTYTIFSSSTNCTTGGGSAVTTTVPAGGITLGIGNADSVRLTAAATSGSATFASWKTGTTVVSTATTICVPGLNGTITYTANYNAVANTAPVANNDSYSTSEDTPLITAAPGVLGNDTDADSNPLTASLVLGPTNGSLTLNANGSFTYTPAANYNGPDSFTYKANDGTTDSNVATVSLTVNAVNDNPVATDDTATVAEDSSSNAVNVLANDNDGVDSGETLSVTGVTQGSNGSVTFTATGVSYTPNANYFGSDSFTYTIGDGNSGSATATVNVTVTNVNDDPVAGDDSATVAEDSSNNAISVLANDNDGVDDGETLSVTAVTQGTNGSVTFTATGVSYTPNANYFGSDSFTYTIGDGNSGSATATVNVTVTNVNDDPVAGDDSATVAEDSSNNAISVLANDNDGVDDGETLSVTAVTQGTNGSVTFTATGVSYTPDANYFGSDSFTYTISDGNGGSDTATVNVTVTNVNDDPVAGDDSATVAEDSGANAVDVLANDNDGVDDGETLSVTAVTQGTNGSVTFTATGVSYTPNANYFGSDSFTYTIGDNNGGSDTATVNVTVTNVNDNPVAGDDSATVAEDSSNNAIDVLANDDDGPDVGETLSVTAVTQGTNGSVSFTATGVSYTPNADYFGSDSFTYTIGDGNGGSDTATVSVTVTSVNDNPVAGDDTATVAEDSTSNPIDVLLNDDDGPDTGETLEVTAVTQGTNGAVTFTATGVNYVPAANFFGSDSFTYTIGDGNGGSDTATVNVTVTNVNDDPVATDDADTVSEDSGANAIDVLANDNIGPDTSETLTITSVTQGANGTVAITGGGTGLTYTPAADYFGSDSFTYTIGDGNGGSDTATVNVTVTNVNDDPVAGDDTATVLEDSGANAIAVLANDNDGPDVGETLSISSVTQGGNGSVAITGGGTGLTYTPNANYFGSDSFTYTIGDGNGGSDTATVNVTVTNVNDDPVAGDDTASILEDSGANAIDVLANDNDGPDVGETLTVASVTQGTNGSVTFTATGVSYTPNADFFGSDSFTYTIGDGNGGSDTATVDVTVTNVNDDPVAGDDTATVLEDSGANAIAVLANDNDGPDVGETLTVTAVTQGTNGSVTFTATGVSYTPNADYFGSDSFTYTISDGNRGSDTATVNVTVTNVNDDPVAGDDTATVDEDSGANAIAVLANDNDGPDVGETLSISSVTQGVNGSVAITGGGTGLTYTPNANYFGSDSFTYTIGDGNGGSDTATVEVTVTNVNDDPVAGDDTATVLEDSGANAIAVLANDNDGPDVGEILTVTAVTQGANGSVTFTATGVSYTPNADYFGSDSFTYTISDGNGGSDTATVNVTVTNVNDDPVATDDTAIVAEDSGANAISVLANDNDGPDVGETLTVTAVTQGTNGSVTFTATGVSYTPNADYFGSDSFTYTISDGNGGSDTATVGVTVNNVNDNPIATNDSASMAEDSGANAINVLANDNDGPDVGETLTVTSVTQGASGSVAITGGGTGVSYTPSLNFFGADSFTYTIGDGNGGSATATVSVTVTPVNDAPAGSALPATQNLQYSDPIATITVTATDVDNTLLTSSASTQWNFNGGSFTSGLPTGLSFSTACLPLAPCGSWTISGNFGAQPGTYVIRTNVTDGTLTTAFDATLVVAQEDARATYTGTLFATTGAGTTAVLTLSATIQDITAVIGDPAYDPDAGDIRNATVTFVNRDNNATLCTATIGLVSLSDLKTGTATCSWTASLSGGDATSYTIGIVVGGYYIRNSSEDNAVVEVAPGGVGAITGGGYLILQSSAGQTPGAPGSRNNFGFNVKYNKKGTNLQGHINTIVRNNGRVYQIKGNSMTSLGIDMNVTPAHPYPTATFSGKANIQDITDPLNPISVDGNATLKVVMTDRGEPGKNDSIAITVWNKSGGLWFSSAWTGTATSEQVLAGGNLVVH
jgi:hypothetical protein